MGGEGVIHSMYHKGYTRARVPDMSDHSDQQICIFKTEIILLNEKILHYIKNQGPYD